MTITITWRHLALVAVPVCWWLAGNALNAAMQSGRLTSIIAAIVFAAGSVVALVALMVSF